MYSDGQWYPRKHKHDIYDGCDQNAGYTKLSMHTASPMLARDPPETDRSRKDISPFPEWEPNCDVRYENARGAGFIYRLSPRTATGLEFDTQPFVDNPVSVVWDPKQSVRYENGGEQRAFVPTGTSPAIPTAPAYNPYHHTRYESAKEHESRLALVAAESTTTLPQVGGTRGSGPRTIKHDDIRQRSIFRKAIMTATEDELDVRRQYVVQPQSDQVPSQKLPNTKNTSVFPAAALASHIFAKAKRPILDLDTACGLRPSPEAETTAKMCVTCGRERERDDVRSDCQSELLACKTPYLVRDPSPKLFAADPSEVAVPSIDVTIRKECKKAPIRRASIPGFYCP